MHLKKSLIITGALLGAGSLCAQLFWNPAVDEYSTIGGDGTWSRTGSGWWNGTANVNMADNTPVVFEGQGNVSATGQPRPTSVTFQNLTGDYAISGQFAFESINITGGSHSVSLTAFDVRNGNRTITNNGSGVLEMTGGVRRQLGGAGTSLNFEGSGDFDINVTNMGFMAGDLVMNGTGRLSHSGQFGSLLGETNNTGYLNIRLNSGELLLDGFGNTNFVWNAGTLVFELSNTDASSNTITLGGDFTRGSGTTFEIDFQNTGIEETYTLVIFENTTFTLSDFTAVNSPQPGSFSFGTTTIDDVDYQTLLYTIPEPRVYAAIVGLLALGLGDAQN